MAPSRHSGSSLARCAVVTDSTCDIPEGVASDHGITIVPIRLNFGDELLDDGVLSQAQLFERMASGPLPTTSQPSVGALIEAYERALETAEEVVSVHISEKLSGTMDAARLAAERFSGKVHVFDSLNLSWGLGWQVISAARSANDGASARECLELLGRLRAQVRQVVTMESLENLRRGGRVGPVAAFVGSVLQLKVTVVVDPDGSFSPLARSRGTSAAIERTLMWIGEQMDGRTGGLFAVGHAMSSAQANHLAEEIQRRWQPDELVMYEAGSAISTHTGRVWGASFLPL